MDADFYMIQDVEVNAIRKNLHIGNPKIRDAMKRDEEARQLSRRKEEFQKFDKEFLSWERGQMLSEDICVTSARRGPPDIRCAHKTHHMLRVRGSVTGLVRPSRIRDSDPRLPDFLYL